MSASVRLELEGMTCAACAARIERSLNGLEGVEASVNFATEQAAVAYDDRRVALDDLVRDRVGLPVGQPSRAGDDAHHLRGEPP